MGLFDKVLGKNKNKKEHMISGFPFGDAENTACITCCHVMKENKPILHVSHDKDDGMWQFLCGSSHDMEEAMVVALNEIYLLDESISSIATLPLGYIADRKDTNSAWKVRRK